MLVMNSDIGTTVGRKNPMELQQPSLRQIVNVSEYRTAINQLVGPVSQMAGGGSSSW